MAVNYERHIVLRKENITTLTQTMLGTLTGMITLSHMDSKFMAALTAGAQDYVVVFNAIKIISQTMWQPKHMT